MNIKTILTLGLISASLLGCAKQKVAQISNVLAQPPSWEEQNKIAIEAFKHAKPNPCFVQNKGVECYQKLAEPNKGQ